MKSKKLSSDRADVGGPISEEIEAHLLKALKSPAIEVTREYIDAKHRALEKWHRDRERPLRGQKPIDGE